MLATWWKYLRIAWVREPVGQRYLRRMLVSFKFELNTFVAALVSLCGVAVLGIAGVVRWPPAVVASIGVGLLAALAAKAARDSSEVLADVRPRLSRVYAAVSVANHRVAFRPLRGGTQIFQPDTNQAGTIGTFLTSDGVDRWLLTAFHVVARGNGRLWRPIASRSRLSRTA